MDSYGHEPLTLVKGKSLVPLGEYPKYLPTYTPIYGSYHACIGQYGVIYAEHLLGYPPKCTASFPLISTNQPFACITPPNPSRSEARHQICGHPWRSVGGTCGGFLPKKSGNFLCTQNTSKRFQVKHLKHETFQHHGGN